MKALRTWPPRLFEVRAAFRMSKPVMLLGGGGVGGEIGGPSDRAAVPLVLAKPRSQSPLLWGAIECGRQFLEAVSREIALRQADGYRWGRKVSNRTIA